MGYDYVRANLKPLHLQVRRADAVGTGSTWKGNQARALGAVYGGATVCAWYPFTPSTSLAEAFTAYCQDLRTDPEPRRRATAIIQAEDEIASIGIVVARAGNGLPLVHRDLRPGRIADDGVHRAQATSPRSRR
jgi:2-oxoglutarate ferredoxin oxidoreductase subunit alpha